MCVPITDDILRKVCDEIYAETGEEVHVVDARDRWKISTAWNGFLSSDPPIIRLGRPSCCFKPRCRDDVASACRVAARHGLKISARGSGHHYGGVSLVEGALLLDLSQLRSVEVDPVTRTARVGPAATARQLRSALAPHGLHFPLPHLSDVGLSGYLLGGGNGWGVRQWGAAADNVEEIEVVLLSGSDEGGGGGRGGAESLGGCRLVRVSSETDPELFWGLRGGGFFLGVATEFVLRLHPVPPSLPLIAATYPLGLLEQLAEFFREFHSGNPTCVEASLAVVGTADTDGGHSGGGCGDGARAVVVLSCHAFAEPGSDEVEESYGKLRGLLPHARLSLQEGAVPYEEALSVLDAAWSFPGLCMYGHGAFAPVTMLRGSHQTAAAAAASAAAGGSGLVAALAAAAARMTSPRSILLVCPSAPSRPGCVAAAAATAAGGSGGCCPGSSPSAAGEEKGAGMVPPGPGSGPGCLGFRDTFFLGIYGMWVRSGGGGGNAGASSDADGAAEHVAWVRSCAADLDQYIVGLYVNEVMHDEPGQVRRSYEAVSYSRLLELKQRVDPAGLLRALPA